MAQLATVGLALAALAGCGDDSPPSGSATPSPSGPPSASASTTPGSASPTPSSSPSPSASATKSATTFKSVPVYFVGESQKAVRLFREFRAVPNTGGLVASAVNAMTRTKPLDDDYSTPWRPASRVLVSQRGDAISVDLSADAFSNTNVGSELASMAVQQLVHTATAAASQAGTPATTVTITKDGKAADAWGVERIGTAMKRSPMLDVQALAWVVSPQQGEVRKAGTVAFTGYGTSFEATFGWVVRTSGGATVARGSAMGGTGTGGFGTVSWSARLAPGTYTVTLSTDDPSGGESTRGPATDDKTFTVR